MKNNFRMQTGLFVNGTLWEGNKAVKVRNMNQQFELFQKTNRSN